MPAGMIRAAAVALVCLVLGFACASSAFAALPVINNFAPTSGVVGDVITINGSSFSISPTVQFTGSAGNASIVSATTTQIQVKVKVDAKSGPITVTNATGSTASHASFTVAVPNISNISPPRAPVGTTVTITGTNFSTIASQNILQFSGTTQWNAVTATVTASTSTSLTTTVPAGAFTGPLMLTVGTKATTSSMNFTIAYPPVITSFSPTSGVVGDPVTISGSSFGTTGSADRVTFNGVPAAVGSNSTTNTIYSWVPANATTGPIAVVVAGITATSSTNFTISCPAGTTKTTSTLAGLVGVLGGLDGTGVAAQFRNPAGVTVDGAGNSYVADYTNDTIRKVTSSGVVTTLAGLAGTQGTNDGSGSSARFILPRGVAVDGTGNVYVADTYNDTIRKVTAAGVVTTIAGTPQSVGIVDGTGSAALFNLPTGIAIDSSGNLYVADYGNSSIRKVTPAGVVSTFAGLTGSQGSSDGMGSAARFFNPHGITVDSAGNLFVTDAGNNTIRKITSSGLVSTVAGLAGSAGSTDDTGSAARFSSPYGVTIDSSGTLYVSDTGNHTIRQITPAGVVTTIAGSPGVVGSADGVGSAARFKYPTGISLSVSGRLVVTDSSNETVRILATTLNCAAPATPTISVPSTSSTAAVTVSWTPNTSVGPITYFKLQRAPTSSGSWSDVNLNIAANLTSYQDTVPSSGTYYYQIAACNQTMCSSYAVSTAVVVTLPPTPPNAPTSISVPASSSTGSFTVSWTPSSSGSAATFFKLQQAPAASGPWTPVNLNIPASQTSYAVSVGTGTYYYEVAACNTAGCSAYIISSAIVVTPPPPPPPNAPAVSVPGTSSSASVLVSWVPSGGTATSFAIYRGTSANGNWGSPIGTVGAGATTYPDVVPGNGTYYYQVTAINGSGSASGVSNAVVVTIVVTVTPPALPPAATAVNDLPTHDPTVGTMAGQAGTDGGAATYTIPIVVPPGRAGMQPSLSLNYNSRSGNGVMGVGWTISGLSSIHRCPRTMEQDNQTLGVAYTGNDRLCLDGQRLVPGPGYSNTQYGQTGTHYRTEVDSYTDIVQNGGNLTSTSTYFVVQSRDGRLSTYGQSSSAQVLPFGATYPLSWLVQQTQDRVGNNQVYSYANYGNGEVLVASVTYTGYSPTSTAGNRTVTFAYQPRANVAGVNDVSSSYLAGGLTMQTKALLSITTAVGGVTVRTYTPHYVPATYSARLLMASMTECAAIGGSSACHSPTQFSYNDDALNTSGNFPFVALNSSTGIPLGSSDQSASAPVEFHSIGDLDGDGTRETAVGVIAPSGGTEQYYLTQTGADRTVNPAVNLTGTGFDIQPNSYADIDGDGRAELIKMSATGGYLTFGAWKLGRGVAIPAGATYSTLFTDYVSNIAFNGADMFYTGDFNGDGRIDVVRVVQNAGSTCAAGYKGVYIYLNATTGTLGSAGNTTANFTVPSAPAFCLKVVSGGGTVTVQAIDHIGDFNGDGLPDFYLTTQITNTTGGTTTFDGIQVTQTGGASFVFKACGSAIGLTNDPTVNSATDVCTWAQPTAQTNYVSFMDVNGDGLEDMVLARPNQDTWRVILNKGGSFGSEINTGSSEGLDEYSTGSGFRYTGRLPTMDVDSDGRPDLLIPSNTQGFRGFALKMCTVTLVAPGTDGCPFPNGIDSPDSGNGMCPVYSCPEDPVGPSNSTGSLDMPADTSSPAGYHYAWNGLPAYGTYGGGGHPSAGLDNSIYHLSMLKFEQTSATQVSVQRIETPLVARLRGVSVLAGRSDSLFGDGLADLTTVVGCTSAKITYGSGATINACSTVFDDTDPVATAYGPRSQSTLPDGSPICTTQPDGSCYFDENPVLYVGLNEGVTAVGGSPSKPQGKNSQPGIAAVAKAAAAAPLAGWPTLPGLLYSSTNGLGDYSQWFYAPLSLGMKYQIDGAPGYSVTGSYVDGRHYYFASSMPIVYEMFQSTGIGTLYGFRGAAYDYSNAMYNHFGRGFQGFQSITTIVGNPTSSDNRVTDTITTYNQKFPLAGRVASVQILARDLSGGTTHTVSQETDYWTCGSNRSTCLQGDSLPTPTGTAPYQVVLDSQTVNTYDLSTGALMAEVDTCNFSVGSGPCSLPNSSALVSGWDAYGNLTSQIATHKDKGAAGTLFLDSSSGHNVQTTNTYATPDTANWWVNQLLNSSVTSSVTYASGHALPSGTSAPSQTLNTGYSWNADRTPQTKSVQSGYTNQQSTTTYSYPSPSYGLPSSLQVTASDLASALSPTRSTSFTYTKDGTTVPPAGDFGYFVLTTTNALNQTTTTQRETNDGQVTAAIDPNGIQAITTYDPFGRATRVDHLGNTGSAFESPVRAAYTSCQYGCSGVGEDGNESNAAYRVTTVQAGYPTKVTWYDILGRSIKSAQAVYTGTGGGALNYKFSATFTTYDDMGMVADQFPPYFVGAAPACFFSTSPPYCYTSFTYDSLGRPVMKMGVGAELDPVHGDMETDYSYSSRKTNIVVHAVPGNPAPMTSCPTNSTTNLCLSMTRSTNALGQLMQTTESPVLTTGSTHLLSTNYWTEPQGHVVAMTDAQGNITSASYNALGQRTQSADPDQGTWNFQYDAFGELLSQTDARGATSTVTGIDALGRTTQRQAAPPASVPTGMDGNTIVDSFSYAANSNTTTYCTGKGELCSASRQRGTVMPYPTVWNEVYGYESTTARPSYVTTAISEGSSPKSNLVSYTSYDADGRVNTHQYPSGLTVQNTYTAYGQLDALSNAGTGYVYWASLGENEWQHTVSEQYPGVITGTHADYDSTGQAKTLSWSGAAGDTLNYTYDSFGNLTKQSRLAPYSNAETYTYDAVQRLIQASRTSGNIVSYAYSDSGNITTKTDFGTGTYSYGAANSRTSGCGPHAVYAVGSAGYSCDNNGNVIGGNQRTLTFDVDNKARTAYLTSTGGSITWAYNTLGERDYENDGTERYFVGDGYRIEGAATKHELGPIIVSRTAGTDSISVALRDRLGSTLNVIDSNTPNAREYDAFGKPRNGDMTDRTPPTLNYTPDTIYGFTDHEHDDTVQLIHMKGRVFDYGLGRFLSVDPIIGNPLSSQSLNPYSYIGNNPLSGTDPTGYDCQVDIKGEVASACLSSNDGVNKITDVNGHTIMTAIVGSKGDSIEFSSASGNGASFGATFTGHSGDITRLLTSPTPDIGSINERSNGALEGVAGAYAQGNDKAPAHITDVMAQQQQARAWERAEAFKQETFANEGMRPGSFIIDAPVGDLADYLNTVRSNGFFSKAAGVGLLGLGLDAVTLGRGGGIAGTLEKDALAAGQAGRFADLKGAVGDALTPHHMPQAALNFTRRADGGALVLPQAEHELTRTYGARGAATARSDAGVPFRDVLSKDIRDVRSISGSRYNNGIFDLLQYYRENYPELMQK